MFYILSNIYEICQKVLSLTKKEERRAIFAGFCCGKQNENIARQISRHTPGIKYQMCVCVCVCVCDIVGHYRVKKYYARYLISDSNMKYFPPDIYLHEIFKNLLCFVLNEFKLLKKNQKNKKQTLVHLFVLPRKASVFLILFQFLILGVTNENSLTAFIF